MRGLVACLVATLLVAATTARPNTSKDSERLLLDRMTKMREGRRLNQAPSSAVSRAVGGESASARAVAGPGVASTQQSATGPGSQVAGVSQVGQRVDACVRGPASSAACQTLTTEERAVSCTDIPPAAVAGAQQFTCPEQAGFGKCDSQFIYLGAFCLQSCGRCGGGCLDNPPTPTFSCALAVCNTTEVISGPFCLRTCGRCTTAAAPAPPPSPAPAGSSAQASATAGSGTGLFTPVPMP